MSKSEVEAVAGGSELPEPSESSQQGAEMYSSLQLERVEQPRAGKDQPAHAPFSCQLCQSGIEDEYFTYNQRAVCPRCKDSVEAQRSAERGHLGAAALLGTLAACAGAALYYGVAALTGYELGLIAIVVGIGVGKAVRLKAGTHDHWSYRALAVGLTYLSITATYIPGILAGLEAGVANPIALLIAVVFSWIAPVFMILEMQIMGLVILAIGLWEAWRFSSVAHLTLEGPFRLRASTPSAAPSA